MPAAARFRGSGRPCAVAARLWLLVLLVGGSGAPARAAQGTAVDGAPVELPPMMVEESVSSVPWLYVNAGGSEFLSRYSASTTRHFVEAWLMKMQLVRALVPEEFLVRMDVPAVFVLYAQDMERTVSAEIQRELQAGDSPRQNRVDIAPNMRLSDRDMHASIVYFDESRFESAAVSVAPGHVGFLLRRRVPELPGWLVDGLERLWRGADFVMDPITLRPLIWNTSTESEALASDPTRPRALLPANELFADGVARAGESRHPRRIEARGATEELFLRWALVSGPAMRQALWKLAGNAAGAPVTEDRFEKVFGFGYSELRDRLSDFLPKAVKETVRIDPGKAAPLPRIQAELATPNEVARLRGEWERLAIGYVQRRMPKVREPYIAQARRTLHRAYDAGDRDPRLLATMGLCEIDAGNEAGAREFLEPAVARGVVRPRAYYELARLRFAELRHGAPDTKSFSYTELAPVIERLRRALPQAPPLPENYLLLGEAWARCELSPNDAEVAELVAGAQQFALRPGVGYAIAHALARHGRKEQALAVLETTGGNRTDENTRARISRLRAELADPVVRHPGPP